MLANKIRVVADGSNRFVRFRAILPVAHGNDLTAFGRTRIEAIRRILSKIESAAANEPNQVRKPDQR
jgi:hypothetical protein